MDSSKILESTKVPVLFRILAGKARSVALTVSMGEPDLEPFLI